MIEFKNQYNISWMLELKIGSCDMVYTVRTVLYIENARACHDAMPHLSSVDNA